MFLFLMQSNGINLYMETEWCTVDTDSGTVTFPCKATKSIRQMSIDEIDMLVINDRMAFKREQDFKSER